MHLQNSLLMRSTSRHLHILDSPSLIEERQSQKLVLEHAWQVLEYNPISIDYSMQTHVEIKEKENVDVVLGTS